MYLSLATSVLLCASLFIFKVEQQGPDVNQILNSYNPHSPILLYTYISVLVNSEHHYFYIILLL